VQPDLHSGDAANGDIPGVKIRHRTRSLLPWRPGDGARASSSS
jgi:hypothetical protein